jgi:hypothetical protein
VGGDSDLPLCFTSGAATVNFAALPQVQGPPIFRHEAPMETMLCENHTLDPNSPEQPATHAGLKYELRTLATIFLDMFLKMSPDQRRQYEIGEAVA